MIESALTRLDAQRAQARRPYYLSLLADTYRLTGHRDRAVSIVETAIDMAIARGDSWWLPALFAQKSELGPATERDRTRRRALEIAQGQHGVSVVKRITAAMAEATTTSPSPSERGLTATTDGSACVFQGATARGAPVAPVTSSLGLAHPPARAAAAATVHASEARRIGQRLGGEGGR